MFGSKGKEDKITKAIESQTSKVPSGVFLAVAIGAMAASLTMRCIKKHKTSTFLGQWAAPLLIMGVYNKIVKTHGHN